MMSTTTAIPAVKSNSVEGNTTVMPWSDGQVRVSRLHTGQWIIGLLALTHLISDAVAGMVSPLLPDLQNRFQLSQTTLALLVATLSLSASVAQPWRGALTDRFGRRRLGAFGIIRTC